ncbi:MAG: phospholipase D-like domain-containing protein, partial [Deltaproteobacteria bacterium]|nr:phospholipase D-like domain-containing protein [Deltaproteobacteria bacterium]
FDNWEDLAVRLEGPSVKTLQRIFMEDWRFSSRLPLRGGEYFPTSNAVPADTRGIVQVVPSGPDEDHGVLGRIYFGALCAARTRAWLMTPYFLPDESFQAALINAALKGVDVRVIIPHRSDNSLVDLASRSFFVPLIEAGVKIFLFHQGMLHAKALLVDDDWSAVGTANMDVRSLRLSFEAGALIHNRQVAHSLEGFCAAQMGQSTQVTLAEATSRRWYARAAQSLARLFSPVL